MFSLLAGSAFLRLNDRYQLPSKIPLMLKPGVQVGQGWQLVTVVFPLLGFHASFVPRQSKGESEALLTQHLICLGVDLLFVG